MWQDHVYAQSLSFPRHAVDWLQEEIKLRVHSKCGKIMFTLNHYLSLGMLLTGCRRKASKESSVNVARSCLLSIVIFP